MPAKPEYHRQETEYSCAPAWLLMVIKSLGLSGTEEQLRSLCDCTILGTEARNVVEAARILGFSNTGKHNLDYDLLEVQLNQGLYPIVYIGVRLPPHNRLQQHSVVVVGIAQNEVQVLDPARGELVVSREEFESAWAITRRLTILIK